MTNPIIWYIHGANSTNLCFEHFKFRFPAHDYLDISYDHSNSVCAVVDHLVKKANESDRPIWVVGHSLGGVIGVAVSQRSEKVTKVATLASPLGGSRIASILRWLCPNQLFEDIHPRSSLISSVGRDKTKAPIMSLVTTSGCNPFITEANDGVVTIESQRAIKGPVYIDIPNNHFEILLSTLAIELVTGFLFNQ